MTSFGKYVSNFVKTAVSSISPNKVTPYTLSQYESEYENCEQLLQQKSIYYFYKVANHFDMVYLPGSVGIPVNGETVYAYRFQGEQEAGVAVFLRYIEVLDPLHLACMNMSLSIDRTYLEKITAHCRNQCGWSAAHVAAAMSWREVFLSESVNGLLNEYDPLSGLTPLRVAIKENDEETVQSLVTMDNIKATEKDEDGNTVLHLVLGDTSAKILSLLLDNLQSLDVNALNNKGESPLHIACRNNSMECIEKLLKAGGNPMIGEFESFPIHIAVNNDSLELLKVSDKDVGNELLKS
uniref:85/88 kDa calcium-independent phospholipase A2 n=1 Tax=Schistosoma haematobium TaxID=6185 RepID=A0A094ZXW2_SCHHA